MKLSTTVFLAVLLSGLGAYYFVLDKPASFQPAAPLENPKVLLLGEGDFLTYFEIQNSATKEKLVLRKKGSDWMLVAPVYYPAENFLVEGMIQALAFSRRDRRFLLEGKDPGEFGLGKPSIRIVLQTLKRPGKRTLVFGSETPVVGGGFYAKWKDEDEVFLIPDPLKSSFERSVYSLRRKKLFRVRWDNINSLYAQSGQTQYRLEKKGELWRWVIPPLAPEIPLEKVSDLIYSFQALYIKEFLDGRSAKEKDFGLQTPEIRLAVGEEKAPGEEKLAFGARAKGKDALYTVREKENLVLLVSEKNLKSLLEHFEVVLRESHSDDSRKNSVRPSKNQSRSRAPRPGRVRSEAGAGDKKRPAARDPGSVPSGGQGLRGKPGSGTPVKKT